MLTLKNSLKKDTRTAVKNTKQERKIFPRSKCLFFNSC